MVIWGIICEILKIEKNVLQRVGLCGGNNTHLQHIPNGSKTYPAVMDVVGIGRRESKEAAVELQYPRATVRAGTVHVGERQRAGG
jgi:hypothetical protein